MKTKLSKYTLAAELLTSAITTTAVRNSEIEETLDNLKDATEEEIKRTISFLTLINLKIGNISELLGDIIEDLKEGKSE